MSIGGCLSLLAFGILPILVPAESGLIDTTAGSITVSSVLWMGDSVAYDLAPGVVEGFRAAGIEAETYAWPGVSLTSEAWLDEGEEWFADHHAPQLEASSADVVFWQLSHFDTATPPDELLLAHTLFADIALQNRHQFVVFVTAPPVRGADESLERANWANVIDAARRVAQRDPGRVRFLDTAALWASTFARESPDGSPFVKPDGMHLCPMAAVVFADYLVNWVGGNFDGVAPTDPATWSFDWWDEERYDNPPGGCDLRPLPGTDSS